MKRILLVLIVIISMLFLNGCCCIVCPPVYQTGPEIFFEGMTKCQFLKKVQEVTPETDSRYVKDKSYAFTDLAGMMKIFEEFDIMQVNAIQAFHDLYPDLPFGYMEFLNGMKIHITIVYNVQTKGFDFYKVFKDKLVKFLVAYPEVIVVE